VIARENSSDRSLDRGAHLVYVFASLEQFFCNNYSADLHRKSRWRTSPDLFFSDATLVQKKFSDVSGKITSSEFVLLRCYNSTKNCSDVSGKIHVGEDFFASNRFLLQ
jgi:hypothetical protein